MSFNLNAGLNLNDWNMSFIADNNYVGNSNSAVCMHNTYVVKTLL